MSQSTLLTTICSVFDSQSEHLTSCYGFLVGVQNFIIIIKLRFYDGQGNTNECNQSDQDDLENWVAPVRCEKQKSSLRSTRTHFN
jgi:hypothetical protein